MAKQLNVNLAFSADTSKVKAQLQDLQTQLNKLALSSKTELGITKDIESASRAAAELSVHLKNATNQQTGTLDFSKLNQSIKQSGTSLQQYGHTLQSLGPQGQQVFMSLAQAVANSEVPIRRTNAMLKEVGTTLANTARWQLSSSILHGFMGAVQSAYGYAQDLNESLNNIRIVTGQSIDQMARFAEEANKAARALSTTTTEYTNASLIYYQQGLNNQQVKERTDITIKMANAAGQSAQIVSDQLTAIWNNFYDGSKSLEYYADVMTALGAATASSTDEIAGGLEKFAAIGETIGLSYEYAASALATITSNTRQSEEVVGTALKTIFARIQGLNLGETLDDGTTLNKYSEALQSVGISIFDQAGELKNMDNILNEMADKWDILSKAQQVALAQTVAGVRQYTQLVSLMDNWDNGDSDSMIANLDTAYNSTGALQDQADIYAESWEAARDRVRAAAESVYKSLINDEFFIDVLNNIEKIIGFVDHLIDNLGGLKGVLSAIGAIVTKVFANQISQGLTNITYNLRMMTEKGRQAEKEARKKFIDDAVEGMAPRKEYTTDVEKAQQQSMRSQLELQQQYMENADRMSAVETEVNKKMMDRVSILRQQVIEAEKRKETASKTIDDASYGIITDIAVYNKAHEKEQGYVPVSYDQIYAKNIKPMKELAEFQVKIESKAKTAYDAIRTGSDSAEKAITQLNKQVQANKEISSEVKQIFSSLDKASTFDEVEAAVKALNQELSKAIGEYSGEIKNVVGPDAAKKVDQYVAAIRDKTQAEQDSTNAAKQAEAAQQKTSESIKEATGAQKGWSDLLVESANLAFSTASAFQMLSSAWDTIKDPDVSGWDKFLSIMMTLGMVIPTFISIYKTLKSVISLETIAKIANAAATWGQVAAEKAHNKERGANFKLTKENIKQTNQDTKNKIGQKKGKNLITSWNQGALEKDTRFTKLDNGRYSFKGSEQTFSANVAGKKAGADAFKALGTKVASGAIAAAGIAIIIGTVVAVVNQLNKAEKAVEKAKAAAQALSENYDNVKASYDNFINAQSGYETATASMKELTKGTVAYQEALLQANEAAGNLLATNKNLKYTIEGGKIVIDKESLEQAKVDELRKMEIAQAAKIAGQRELDEAKMALDKRDMARDLKSYADRGQKGWNALAGGVLSGLGAGAAAGSIIGGGVFSVPAALIGGAIGAAAGAITGLVAETSTDTENKAIDLLAKQAEKDETFLARLKAGRVEFDELKSIGLEDEGLIASLQKNGEEVAALIGEMQANTAAINAQNDLVASNALSDNEVVQNSEYKDQIIDIAGDAYGHAYDKAMESEWINTWGKEGISKLSGANEKAKDVFKDYLEYAGLEGQGYELIDTTGTDANRKFIYKDKDGQEHEVSLEAMQAARAAAEASKVMDDNAVKLAQIFDELARSSEGASQALLSFVSQKNFENATYGEFQNISSQITKDDNGDYEADSIRTYLAESLGEKEITDDIAIRHGWKDAEAMIQGFSQSLSRGQEMWDSTQEALKGFNFNFSGQLTLDAAQSLESQLEQIKLGPLGEKGAQEYLDGLNKMLENKGLDTEEQQEALSQLTKIDWSDWDAMEQAEEILKSFGATIDADSESWSKFTDEMRKANNAIPDFSSLITELTAANEVLGDLKFGSIIKDEDYQKLIDYNKEWEHLFVLQSDGSRKFIGNAQQMQAMTKQSLQESRKELAENKKHADALNALEESGTQIFYTDAEIEEMAGGDGKDGLFSFASQDGQKNTAATMLRDIGYDVDAEGKVTKKIAGGGTEDVTQEQASAMVMAIQRGNTAEEIISNNKAVQDALKANNYDEKTQKEIIEEAKKGNSDRLEVMMDSLETIATQNYEQLDQEYDQMIAANATSVQELQSLAEKGQISTQSYKQQLTSLAQEASSLTELQSIQNAGVIDPDSGEKIKLNTYEYGQALSNLAENYENCEDKITAYNNAVASGDPKAIAAAQSQLELGVAVGEAAEEYDLEAEAIEAQAKQMQKTYNITEKEAVQLTIQNQRMNKGVSELVDNWEDWSEVLTTSNTTSQDWTETTSECTKAVAELVGASKDLELPDEFFKAPENLELLKEAAQGSEEAINELGLAVAETQVGSMEFTEGMTGLTLDDIINETEFQGWQDTVTTGIDNLQTSLDTLGINEDVFEKLGGDDWVNALNEMAIATEMSVEEMNNLLNTMGVQAEVSTTTKDTKIWVPTYTTQKTTSEDGKTETVKVVSQKLEQIDGQIEVAQINTGKNIGDKPKIRFTGNGSVSSSAKQGSKSSKPKKADKVKKDDIVERYKEVEDSLSQVAEATEDANKAMDRLYGVSRLKQMEKQNELLEDEVDLLKEKKKQALNYLNEDRKALNAAAKEAGVELNIDENGFITNYTDAMTELYKELDAAINAANADGNADESETERIDAAQKRVDELKSAIGQYDETRDMIKDLDNQLDEKFFEWQDNNAEMLSYKLELNLEINEMDLENIEYELNKIADDFYKMAEAAALMVGTDDSSADNNQLSIYIRALDDYTAQQKALEEAYAAGEISQAAYVEGMKEVKSGIYDNLTSLQELDKSMMEYYGNTLDMAAEEIAEYTDRMDHQVSVLDHYSSLLEIMGKQNDYKTMHKALEAKAQVISDQVAVAKNTMEMYQGQAESRFNEYQDALARGDEKAAELYLKQYEAALAAANEAQDAYLSKAEEWAEALKAVLENKLADIGQTLENALTGGTSFDTISTSMERANSLQEEYLTTTNKIYETNKLISSAQQEIDKSTNLAAKRKLRSFQDETSILQSQGKLSKFELEIQQAKYDLLLAEIALEDARNAKDTVRLQRDSEGNFGYVYTANENKVNEAEQNALDKENALYNIRLEGANEYTEKYQQTMQEMYDTLQDLTERYHNGEFESEEEYRQAMEDARAYYYQKLTDYSQLYTEAISDDVRIMEDAWSTEFGHMTENTDEWMKAVDIYVSEVEMVFNDYQEKMNQIAVETGTSLDAIENGIKDVVDESESLRDILIGEDGLISAFDDQIDAVATITSHYATLRESLGALIEEYEATGIAASNAIKKQQEAMAAIQATNTALNAQAGTVGDNSGNVVKDEGNNSQQTSTYPPVPPPQMPASPTNSMITVYPTFSDTGRGGLKTAQITVGEISSLDGKPLQGGFKKNMWEIKYHGASKIGYVDNEGYQEYVRYKKEKQDYDKKMKAYEQEVREYEKKYNIASMDTGGYTGSWGQSGKLAMLHQKELVLNADDTTNFLTSLEILRKIVKAIDLQAMNAQIGGMLTMPNIGFTPNEMLEQQVHIEASFPGVSDRNEIEEAFKTLVNRASQFANRKNF